MFKSKRSNRLITVIFWIILIFIAVVNLPNVTHLATDLNESVNQPSQIAKSRQLNRAKSLQHGWGRRLGNTKTADVVYNNRNGQITSAQQRQIDQNVKRLQKHANQYGIQKITDLNTDRNGSDELKSHDNSTEIVQLSVESRYQGANSNIWADEIKDQAKVPSLRSSVTSPSLLKAASVRSTVHHTVIITIVGLLLSSLAIGLLFKSLIAPVISLVSLLITDLISLSLSGNLVHWTGFTEYTPLTISLTTIIMGTITTYFIYQAVINELPSHRDANNAVQQGLKHMGKPVLLSGVILTLAFGAAVLIPETIVKPITNLGITFAVLTLAELTLIPTFMSWLGTDILWPSHGYEVPSGHKLWNRLVRLSLWQPLIGIIAVIYFIVPFAYSYRTNFEYSQTNDLPTNSQAYQGDNALKAHFTAGKPTPVTIYIKSPRKFDRESTLKTVDDLTTKLQSMSGVNSVYSVTQPSGMPINKYYVNHQLNVVNDSLNRNQDRIYQTERELKRGHKKLSQKQLKQIQKHLNKLNNVRNDVPKINLDNRFKQISSNQKASVAAKLDNYRSQLQDLNGRLSQLSSNLGGINTVNDNVKSVRQRIKSVNHEISSTIKQLKRVNDQLNDIYGYLSSLQRSTASHQYFITPDQIQDTDFQQSLINFTSQDERATKLQVIFNQTPSTKYNQARLIHLRNEVQTTLQGTSLSQDKVALSGIPVQQATVQKHFRSGLIKALLIATGIVLLGLMLISRSILHPIFWLISFVISSLAGLQITELIIRYVTNQAQFNWQLALSITPTLIGLATLELVPISLAYRHRRVTLIEWLHETFTDLGQNVTAVILITALTIIALFTGLTVITAQIALVILITIVIFNWTLPLLAAAFVKYFKMLPHSRI